MSFLTVGIPFFNNEEYLASAIKSVLIQSFSNFKLILLNDGSTDNSLSIAKSFNDPRIEVINDNRNMGLIFRLNQLIDITTTEYFVRMDADDLMFPNRLELQYSFLKNNILVDIVGSDAISIDKSDNVTGYRSGLNNFSAKSILKSGAFIHPTVMGKTSWFLKYKYLDGFNRAEDLELWMRSCNYSYFKCMPLPTIFYREGCINVKNYNESGKTVVKIYKKYQNLFSSKLEYYLCILLVYLKIELYKLFFLFNRQDYLSAKRTKKISKKDIIKYSLLINHLKY